MYRRKLIDRHIPDDPSGAVFCHITVALCEGESSLTHKIDAGFGDYYRLQATEEWCDTTSFPGVPGTYSGMEECTGARSYSPVNPFNDQTAQFIIKEVVGKPSDYGCTGGVNCKFGFSELACNLPIGSDILMSKDPDHYGVQSTHLAYKPNFDRDPGNGPYTINYVGQGVALTELNPNGMSQLMKPFASDGNFSNIKEVNYLWANSYYSSAEWIYEKTTSNDLAQQFMQEGLKYGIRFNLMNAISREDRPEADIYGRADVDSIGKVFNLTNTTDQDPNIKWFVVGSKSYKKSIYPQITEWGFDMAPCPGAESKGYPYCGPNALYGQCEPGAAGLANRERSDLWDYYIALTPEPTSAPSSAPTEFCEDDPDFVYIYTNKNDESEVKGGCEFVAESRTKKRCQKVIDGEKVRKSCRVTCNDC